MQRTMYKDLKDGDLISSYGCVWAISNIRTCQANGKEVYRFTQEIIEDPYNDLIHTGYRNMTSGGIGTLETVVVGSVI